MILDIFGNRVRDLRNSKMLSQVEFSHLSGIDRTQISKIEQGKINVTLVTIEKISEALNVEIKDLMNISNEKKMRPFVKWAGGKTQILSKICELMPNEFETYFEPFVGGGALFLYLAPEKAYINDSNSELMGAYECLKDLNKYTKLLKILEEHEVNHSEEYYYEIRALDRNDDFEKMPVYERAARMIYLNKACYNGLYRVNSKGYFNVPSGRKTNVNTYDRDNMLLLRNYFLNNDINILNTDFEEAVKSAKEGDFVYFDPPYDTLDEKDTFTSYSKDSFGKEAQTRLARVYQELSDKGVKVMLSNHNTRYINELYKEFNKTIIKAKRMINSNADGRGEVEEIIITNY
ncbi:MAG: Dam family site-specific DNA-(adenine-N6)-methyltransferase [Bacilli bacterium]|jgi:DNA adenine methylase